ncbi:MAG: hypothetical protein ACRDDY_02680 [Clostridium sp.]|uniref:hypothetical protein n=1 Tax=Clostridium sp. TaxID=1506 RepID=UPI003EE8064B
MGMIDNIIKNTDKEEKVYQEWLKGFATSYNKLVARLKKADNFFNNPAADIEVISQEKYLNAYTELVIEFTKMQKEYKQVTGEEMTLAEKENGVKM